MKPKIHPQYKRIKIKMPDGDEFETRSTYGKEEFLLEIDFRKHRAWSKSMSNINVKAKKVASFNKKFAGINFGISKKS